MALDAVVMDDLKHILKETVSAICRSRLHDALQLSVEVRLHADVGLPLASLFTEIEQLAPCRLVYGWEER